ncbi:hypothetical protein D3C71_1672410 [compost metagenome]
MALAQPAIALPYVGGESRAKGAAHELVDGGPQALALRAYAFDVERFLRAGLGRGLVELVGVGAIVGFVPGSVEEYGKVLHHDRLHRLSLSMPLLRAWPTPAGRTLARGKGCPGRVVSLLTGCTPSF